MGNDLTTRAFTMQWAPLVSSHGARPTPFPEQPEVLFPSKFGILVLLSKGGGGVTQNFELKIVQRHCLPRCAPPGGCIRTAIHRRRRGGGSPPPLDPPPALLPFQCLRLTAEIFLWRLQRQGDFSLKFLACLRWGP